MSNKNIESNLKKLLKGEKACVPEHFLKVPSYNSPTLRVGKGKALSNEGAFGKTYRGSINDNGRRYVAYKEIDTSKTVNGAFEFEFKVAQKLKEFAVPEMYLFKKCPIQKTKPKGIRKEGKPGSKMGHFVYPLQRTKPKDILYMELLNGKSFNSWWQTNPSIDAIKSVMIQVFDNIYRISEKYPDFRHRDLHGGNVMVDPSDLTTQYTWIVNGKRYKRTNAGVTANIIDFGLSYWSNRMPNPETSRGGYEHVGIYRDTPGTRFYDIHTFLYIIYAKVRQPGNVKERVIKNFIEALIPDKEFLEYNGKYTKNGRLKMPGHRDDLNDFKVKQNIPSFKVILTHPFLTGEDKPNQPKTLTEVLKMIPKAKTPPKVQTSMQTRVLPPPNFGKLSTANRKKAMNNMIKKAAAILAEPKAKPVPRRRPGVARPNPVPESPKAPYGVMSPSNLMNLARKVESGRKKAANKLNVKIQAIKATKGKTPTPVRLKEKFSFVNVKGKKREYVKKGAYEKALAKNNAVREEAAKRKPGVVVKKLTPKAPVKENEIVDLYMFTNMKGKEHMYKSKAWYEKALSKNRAARNRDISHATATAVVAVGEVAKLQLKKKLNAKNYAMTDSMIRDLRKLNN
jgi:serine/threonine protein kinase|tara:strand:+ start:4621 stop:6489 length:1869 start_codon:yes stop_codon:yes gene_type:complete